MLHSFEAQLQGSQITWLGHPPAPVPTPRRVVVVMDDAVVQPRQDVVTGILQRARGALGRGQRDAVLAELSQLRQAWSR